MLASGRGVSIIRVALFTAEWWAALAFVGSGDVNVAFAQPLARAQTRAGLPQQA